MQVPKAEVKKIIAEEIEQIENENAHMDSLLEEYLSAYSLDEENVSKEAVLDLMEMLGETKIPKLAIAKLLEYLPKENVAEVLGEVLK